MIAIRIILRDGTERLLNPVLEKDLDELEKYQGKVRLLRVIRQKHVEAEPQRPDDDPDPAARTPHGADKRRFHSSPFTREKFIHERYGFRDA